MKKLFILSLFILLGVFLVSCGNNSSNNTVSTTKTVTLTKSNYSNYLNVSWTSSEAGNKITYNITVSPMESNYRFENAKITVGGTTKTISSTGNASFTVTKSIRDASGRRYSDSTVTISVTAASGKVIISG